MIQDFSIRILRWFGDHGRHDLPWQLEPTPYRVWVSEIMLQQTQVSTVIPYYQRFMDQFPDIHALAGAEQDMVLHLWSGLGYYTRARNLHRCARLVVEQNDGQFPDNLAQLTALPGIGRSTAGAILAIAFQQPATILDGNVKRVLARCFAIAGWPGSGKVQQQLWEVAESLTPPTDTAAYTQAMMDLGATVCTRSRPDCAHCPLEDCCQARQQDTVNLYPGKKPARTLPVKQVTMHMLHNDRDEVLLEKRPAPGIWGGLWSFPESIDTAEPATIPAQALRITASNTWPALRHTFSHFHLDITPRHAKVATRAGYVLEPGRWLWYPLLQPPTVGLAAPVQKLLNQLAKEADKPH